MTNEQDIQKEMIRASMYAISKYQRFLVMLRYGETHPYLNQPDKDHFGFIPSEPEPMLMRLIRAKHLLMENNPESIRPYPIYKFLDAGCGGGNIMLLANCVGFDVWGIERDPETIKLAHKLHYGISERIIKADLIKYKDYGDYDVIYYYQPMRVRKMEVFVDALHSQIKVGAIVIPQGDFGQFAEDSKFKRYNNSDGILMYRKTVK